MALLAAAASAQNAVKLIGTTETTGAALSGADIDIVQPFTTGTDTAGYMLTRVDVRMLAASGTAPTYSVSIWTVDETSWRPLTRLGTLTTRGSWPNPVGLVRHDAPADGIRLAAGTFLGVVLDVTANGHDDWKFGTKSNTNPIDAGAAQGWAVSGGVRYKAWNATAGWNAAGVRVMLDLYGYGLSSLPVDTEPTFDGATIRDRSYVEDAAIKPLRLPAASGGDGALSYTLAPSKLPAGLTWNEASRTISGTPTTPAPPVTYTWTATDSDETDPDSVSLSFSIEITAVRWLAPYWRGGGGFVVRPADGLSASVRLECAGRRFRSVEHAADDGLIVRLIPRSRCESRDGRPLEGDLTFQGIEDGGWYWINGDRNVAVSPLVVEGSLNGGLRPPVPAGVAASPSGDARFVREVVGRLYGTLMVSEAEEGTGFMGVVPHLVDMEGNGEHAAPYWKGGGVIVGRPLEGEQASVRLSCGDGEPVTWTAEPGADGIVAAPVPGGCFDGDGAAVRGHLEADGFEDGAWYWLNGAVPVVAPLLGRNTDAAETLTVPLVPRGVEVDEGPLGTLFARGSRMGIVPRVRTAPP